MSQLHVGMLAGKLRRALLTTEESGFMALGLILWLAAFVAVGYFVRQLRMANSAEAPTATEEVPAPVSQTSVAIRLLQIVPLLVISAVIWTEMRNRPLDESHTDIALLWMISMGFAIVAAAWPFPHPVGPAIGAWLRTYRWEIVAVAIISLVALGLRAYQLDKYPWIYSGDEGTFGLHAREVLDGVLKNPFGTGSQAHPTLWMFIQAGFMRVFGNDVIGSRTISVFFGVATIPLVYLYIRRYFDVLTALTAAALTTIFHFHIFMSRDAQNNITASFFAILVLWLMDRVIDKWRPIDALLAGLAIGLSQHFFAANRMLVFVALVYLGYALVMAKLKTGQAFSRSVNQIVITGVLIAAGIVIAFLPLGAYYFDHRDEYTARFEIVSVFSGDWLEREQEITGRSEAWILWNQFKNAAMVPFETDLSGFYRVQFFDWPLAIAALVGLVIITLGFWQRRYLGLAAAYWGTVAGLALTQGPPQTNRFAMAASLLPVIAAIGLVWITRTILASLRAPMFVMWAVIALVVGASAVWNIDIYFTDEDEVERLSDVNTLVANTFAYELEALGPGYTVYYAGPPRLFYHGHPNLPFIADGATGINVDEPWTPSSERPQLIGPTVFFFTPERRNELGVIQDWFPGGEVIDHTMEDGAPLYTEYRVIPSDAENARG